MTWKTAALLASGALVATACVQVLGNDFVVISDDGGVGGAVSSAGGAGGVGGASSVGGATGSGGSGPPANFECDWQLPNHRQLLSLADTTYYLSSGPYVVRRDAQQARALILRKGMDTETGLLFTVGEAGTFNMDSWTADRIHQMDRISVEDIGVLYQRDGANGTEMVLRLIADNSDNGAQSVNDDVIAYPGAFPNLGTGSINARFTVVSGSLSNPVLDIIAWWRQTDNTYQLGYARYSGSLITTFTPVTATAGFDDNEDVEVVSMTHHDGVTYVWIGADSPLGMRRLELGPQFTLPITPTAVGPLGQFVYSYGASPTSTSFLQISLGPPLQMFANTVPNDMLSRFDMVTGTNLVATWQEVYEIPVLAGFPRWHGSMHVLFGSSYPDPNAEGVITDVKYWIVDDQGNQRGLGTLPFTATLPAGEVRTDSFVFGSTVPVASSGFDTDAGKLHAFWFEQHDSATDQNFTVLYYDQLNCQAVPSF